MKLLAALFFITTFANASTVATLLIKGTIPEILSVTVTPETIAANLPLDTSQTNTKIATLQEKSNSSTGYKINISSSNLGKLTRIGGTEFINYTLIYNGLTVNLITGSEYSNPAAAAVTSNKDIKITYTAISHENMVSGNYADLITFTISAN